MSDFNKQVIEEFRANEGRVGGYFEGATLLLLHTTGAKSGLERVSPVMTFVDDGKQVIIASKAGADTHPSWYHNIVTSPEVSIELGTEQFDAVATVTDEPQRSELYEKVEAISSGFTEYKKKTSRVIPVVTLTRK
jgi:deazaflavin-dependent oxidoreductase (nitroreductase family)